MQPSPSGSKSIPVQAEPLRVCFCGYELDEKNARLVREGTRVPLAPRAFGVLCALARSPGQLITKNALLDAVWGHQHVSDSVLKTVVSELREALGDDPKQPRIIETVSRRGYRFVATLAGAKVVVSQDGEARIRESVVGRDEILTQLMQCWHRAAAGQRQIVWIAGEAGIGKTTLMDCFAEMQPAVRRAHGQCVEQYGTGEPYLPVLEALGALSRDDARIVSLLREFAPTWLLQLPWLSTGSERESLRRELANVGQERMLREFGALLERYTADQTLLLTTEDLHWSDHATVHLINHLARRRGPLRLLWLATYRVAEVVVSEHPLKTLRHELRLHRLCDEFILDPLSERDTAHYLQHRFGTDRVDAELVRALHARTDGLPLFLVNVVDDMVARGQDALLPGAAPWTGSAAEDVPQSLMGVIERQIARLPAGHQSVLQAASVVGLEFPVGLVAEILQQDVLEVDAVCEAIAREGQWLTEGKVSRRSDGVLDARHAFRHTLYRQVLYQGLGASRRSHWHTRAAQGLERLRGAGLEVPFAEIAVHYERSHQLPAAVRHYAEAAQGAMRLFAPSEALALAKIGLELIPRCPQGVERDALELALQAMQGAASAQHLGVGSDEARLAFERARELLQRIPAHPLRGLVLHALGIVLLVQGQYAQVVSVGEYMHSLAERESDPVLTLSACSVLGQAHALLGRHAKACEWLNLGVQISESIGDEALRAAFVVDPVVTIHAALSVPLLHMGRIDDARRSRDAAFARARLVREPMARLVAHWFGCILGQRLNETEQVATWASQLRALAEEAALTQGHAPGQWFGGWAQALLGAPDEGERAILEGLKLSEKLGMRSGASEVLAYAAEAMVIAGRWAEATQRLDEAQARASESGEAIYVTQMYLLRARMEHRQGHMDRAHLTARAAIATARDQEAPWLVLLALTTLCELGTPELADVRELARLGMTITQGRDTSLQRRGQALIARYLLTAPPDE